MSFIQSSPVASTVDYVYMNEDIIDPELKCIVCQQPFVDPMVGKHCGHTFCNSCISNWYRQNSSCPTCRTQTVFKPLTTRIVLSQLDRLLVCCSHCHENKIQKGNFADHINHRCRQLRVKCKAADLKCPWEGNREEQARHSSVCLLMQIRPLVQDLQGEISAQAYQLQICLNEMNEMRNQLVCLQQQVHSPSRRESRAQNCDDQSTSEKEHFDQLMEDLRYRWTTNRHLTNRFNLVPCAFCDYRDGGFLKCLICSRLAAPSHIAMHDDYRRQLTDLICKICVQKYAKR